MSKDISILDKDYLQWIKELSSRYRRSQIKAAVKVNEEVLRFYWELGRDIIERDVENKYGSKFYATLSRDLKTEIQNTSGLSERNLRYTKKFYLAYNQIIKKMQQVAADSNEQFLQQVAAKLFTLPWGHHLLLMDKFPNHPEKLWFYVCESVDNGWSRNMLLNFLDTDLYERQGKALTNFTRTLPEETSDLAQELTKDPYDFAFTGITGRYNERLLKDNLLPYLISAGVPDSVPVAHKHGWIEENDGLLHTMGNIATVYSPGGDYILSIYTWHPENLIFDEGNTLFSQISAAVYNYFNPAPAADFSD